MAVSEHDDRPDPPERLRVVYQHAGDRFERKCVCEQRGWEHLRAAAGPLRNLHDTGRQDVSEYCTRSCVYAAIDRAGRQTVHAKQRASVCCRELAPVGSYRADIPARISLTEIAG